MRCIGDCHCREARNGGNSNLLLAKALTRLIDLAALEVTELLSQALKRRGDGRERKYKVSVVQTRNNLRGKRQNTRYAQAQGYKVRNRFKDPIPALK